MMDAARSSGAGQAIYSPAVLRIYDIVVLGVSNRWIWRVPTRLILQLYDKHVSDDHLDVGVGTGWYLHHCRFPSSNPRVTLMDLNAHSLSRTARRIGRYKPLSIQADALMPVSPGAVPFRSIALTYLLHCLPGGMAEKSVVFDHLGGILDGDGVLFGATLLARSRRRSAVARKLMRLYNTKGVFSNEDDTADALEAALRTRFEEVSIELVGCGALFVARRPRRTTGGRSQPHALGPAEIQPSIT